MGKKVKKGLMWILIVGILSLNTNYSLGFDIKWDESNGKIGYIHQREYYDTLLELVHKAKKDIVISMYYLDYTKREENPLVVNLVDALVNARKRGVKVKVILENTVLLNNRVYTHLMENKIDVFWDHDSQTTHSKLVVIDGKFVVIGSTNWSERALRMNNEAALLVESENVAKTVLAELSKQKVMDFNDVDSDKGDDVIHVPNEFLLDMRYASNMMSASAERAFDLYLLLLKLSQDEKDKPMKNKVKVVYEDIAKYFGNLEGKGLINYKRGIRKELKKLQYKYKLIKYESEYGKPPEVTLLDLNDNESTIKLKKRESLSIPKTYWDYGFSKDLSHAAKFMYLINLHETDMSQIQPWWTMSQDEIGEKYGIIRRTIYKGSTELKEKDILEIEYARTSKYKKGEFAIRPPNKYKLNDLMSDEEREKIYSELANEYGDDNLKEAREMAGALDEPNDTLVAESILDLIKIYGLDKVKKAVAIPAEYKSDNSMKHIRYVIGILQKESKEKK